ncbi:MAG: tRNA methyl transferase PRC-barrel domain-containing protein, partial [Anaerolineales bacterium]
IVPAHGGGYELHKGVDAHKDQSYVLHMLDQEHLAHTLLPLGGLSKAEVRALAAQLGLPVAQRHDSQDLCFLAGEDYRNFIRRNAVEMLVPGEIVRRTGEVLGQHTGLPNYTIGQRKGLGIAYPEPLYVLGKDAAANRLVVGTADELGQRQLLAANVTWTAGILPGEPFRAEVKIRYSARPAPAWVTPLDNGARARVVFDAPVRDITPGQAAVFYNGDVVWGGGVIASGL